LQSVIQIAIPDNHRHLRDGHFILAHDDVPAVAGRGREGTADRDKLRGLEYRGVRVADFNIPVGGPPEIIAWHLYKPKNHLQPTRHRDNDIGLVWTRIVQNAHISRCQGVVMASILAKGRRCSAHDRTE
jgi:hypothetical protein